MYELRRLRHVLALAQHGNFHRAAEALHLTQPALSRSIQALEEQVGALLFDRHRHGVEPTDMGRLLLRHATSLDADLRDLDRDIRLAKGLDLGELRIGVGPWGASVLVGPVVGRLNAQHPRLKVKLIIAPWQELPERARAREVDIVVGELSQIHTLEDFEVHRLSAHPTVVVGRAGHPLTRQRRVTLADLFRHPLIGPRLPDEAERALRALAAREGVADLLDRHELQAVECDSASVLRAVLPECDALSCMPRFMVERELQEGQLVVMQNLPLAMQVRFGAAWLRGRTITGAGGKFVSLLQAHDASLKPGDARSPKAPASDRPRRAAQAAGKRRD